MSPYLESLITKASGDGHRYQAFDGSREGSAGFMDSPEKAVPDFGAVPVDDGRSERIAELDRRIAELKARIAAGGNSERAIGRYRFVYENDPATYMNYMQSLRNAEETRNTRASSDAKTEKQQVLDAWKQTSMDLYTAQDTLARAENAYSDAVKSLDEGAISKAGLDLQRAKVSFNRAKAANDSLLERARKFLAFEGVSADGEDRATGDQVRKDLGAARDFNKALGDLERIDTKPDNVSISKAQKSAFIGDSEKLMDAFEKMVGELDINQSLKNTLLTKLAEKRKSLRDYGKPASKGGQGTTKTAADLAKEMEGKNYVQLGKYKLSELKSAYFDGNSRNPDLITILRNNKILQ